MTPSFAKTHDNAIRIAFWSTPLSFCLGLVGALSLALILLTLTGYALGLPGHNIAADFLGAAAFPIGQAMMYTLLAMYIIAAMRCWRGFPSDLSMHCARLTARVISAIRACWLQILRYIPAESLAAEHTHRIAALGAWQAQTQHTEGVSPPLE